MNSRRPPRTSPSPRSNRDIDSLDLRRHSAARAGLVALAIGAGTGVLNSLLAVWTAAQPSPEAGGSISFPSVVVLLLLGLLIGIAAGAVLAIPASLATLVLRPQMTGSRRQAQVVAGVLGAVGATTLALAVRFWLLSSEFVDGSLVWFLLVPAVVTIGASAWAGPWIANSRIGRGPTGPGRPRSGASPRR